MWISSEFTNLITTQRGYQANSRIITVSDTLLEELINLKEIIDMKRYLWRIITSIPCNNSP